jgi:hypothetical protein
MIKKKNKTIQEGKYNKNNKQQVRTTISFLFAINVIKYENKTAKSYCEKQN